MAIPCPNTQPHRPHGDCLGVMRRATEREIAIAHAWVAHAYADFGHSPELEIERQQEYADALELLIFANGGRYSAPVLFPEETQ